MAWRLCCRRTGAPLARKEEGAMTRRGAHEGTIRYREDKELWEARFRTDDGRQHSLYAKTRRDVQERLRAALTRTDGGIRPVSQVLTVDAWLDEWLAGSVESRLRPTTAENYATILRLYVRPAIGKVPLAKLTPEHVQRMMVALAARGDLSPTTVRAAYAVLRIALSRALKSGTVLRNVCTLVDPPAKARHELAPLTADQARAFLDNLAGDRLEALLTTAIALGMREGELLALRWQDVDLRAGTLTVMHTLTRLTHELAEPKTERARRTLTLPRSVVAVLQSHRVRQAEERLAAGSQWQDRDLVFATSEGRALDARNVLRAYQLRLERAGLPHQRFHDLRHACATLLLEQGEELAVVSKILGHSNLATTADVYAHLTPAMGERVASRMDGILARRTAGGA
jgi:integrase